MSNEFGPHWAQRPHFAQTARISLTSAGPHPVLHTVLRDPARNAQQAARRHPNEPGGSRALFFLPWLDRSKVKSIRYRGWLYKSFLFAFALSFIALSYLGLQPATTAYTNAARFFGVIYFAFFLFMPWYSKVDPTKPVPERVTFTVH